MVALELQGTGARIRSRDLVILELHTQAPVTDGPGTTDVRSVSIVESVRKYPEA